MSTAAPVPGGILIACAAAAADANQQALLQYVQGLGLADAVTLSCIRRGETAALSMTLAPAFQARHAPGHDTTGIAASLGLRPEHDSGDLEREILLAILASPVAFPCLKPPSWPRRCASAATSCRRRDAPPWRSTPSRPNGRRTTGSTTSSAASPCCRAARWSRRCAGNPARRVGPAVFVFLLPRHRIRDRAGDRPGAAGLQPRTGRAPATPVGNPRSDVRAVPRHVPARIRLAAGPAAAALLRAGRPPVVPQPGRAFVQRRRLRRVVGVLPGLGAVQQFLEARPAVHAGRQMRGDLPLAPRRAPQRGRQADHRRIHRRGARARDHGRPAGHRARARTHGAHPRSAGHLRRGRLHRCHARMRALGRAGAYRHRATRLPRPA